MPPALSRILIVRTDNIGDVVLTLPLAGYLKELIPGVQVDLVCRAYAAPVVRCCRHVDRVLALDEVAEAHRVVEASEHTGKVILAVRG